MKKTVWIWIGLGVVLIIGSIATWVLLSNKTAPAPNTNQQAPETSTTTPSTDTQTAVVDITIKDFAYDPAIIQIKKGTKVVWTNQDFTNHNVVADTTQTGGLPTEAALLQKGQSQSFTFDTVGVFSYHCSPHSRMQGSVEVVE